jgi:hypothetical protein
MGRRAYWRNGQRQAPLGGDGVGGDVKWHGTGCDTEVCGVCVAGMAVSSFNFFIQRGRT